MMLITQVIKLEKLAGLEAGFLMEQLCEIILVKATKNLPIVNHAINSSYLA